MAIVDISANLDGEATLGADASATYAVSSTQAGAAILAAEAIIGPIATLAGESTLDATGSLPEAYLDGASTLTGEPGVSFTTTVTVAGAAVQTADATATYPRQSALTASSMVSIVLPPVRQRDATAELTGEASLTVIVDVQGVANLAGESSMTALNLAVTADLAGQSSMTALGNQQGSAGLELPGDSTLTVTVTGALTAEADLAGESSMTALNGAIDADLAGASSLTAVAGLRQVNTAGLAGSSTLTATPRVNAVASLAGSSALTATAAAGLGNIVLADGLATMGATATVAASSAAAIHGDSTLGAVSNYARVQASVDIVGSSELAADGTFVGAYGVDSYGGSPYGSSLQSYGIESATVLSSTQVRIRYTAMFDPGFPLLLSIANYSITPPLVVDFIVLETAQSVVLHTEPLAAILYTVTISAARGFLGQPLDPALNSAQFTGVLVEPSFYAVATGPTRVRAVFSEPMLPDSFADLAEYILTDSNGTPVAITSITIEQSDPDPARSIALVLGEELVHARHYRLTVLSGVVSLTHAPVVPNTDSFQYVGNLLQTQIPVPEFSGEVLYGLYGIHNGLVFFSPALENSAANSIIEVDQVDVCTRAYDEYHPPQPLDPRALLTHGLDLVPTPAVSVINSVDWVLWAAFPRLVEARFDLGMGSSEFPLEDTVPRPTDDWASLTVTRIWPPGRVSLLNGMPWKLFEVDGTSASLGAVAGGLMTVTGLSGMSNLDRGQILTITKAANPANNGNFLIVTVPSSSSVQVESATAVGSDANNGNLVWTKPGAFIVADNLTPFPPPGPSSTTVLGLLLAGEAELHTPDFELAGEATVEADALVI
jgi:hypothetical protein